MINIVRHIITKLNEEHGIECKLYDENSIETEKVLLELETITLTEVKPTTYEVTGSLYCLLGAEDEDWNLIDKLISTKIMGVFPTISIEILDNKFLEASVSFKMILKNPNVERVRWINTIDVNYN